MVSRRHLRQPGRGQEQGPVGAAVSRDLRGGGQLAAAVLAAQTGRPGLVWAAATLAMVTRIGVGVGLTRVLRTRVAPPVFRAAGIGLFVLFGVLSVVGRS